jgi:arsenic resistance protein ArsH
MICPTSTPTVCTSPISICLSLPGEPGHPPRVLMLYGSLRERSYSRFMTMEAKRVLEVLGAEVRVFDPAGLPLVSESEEAHPKVWNCVSFRSGRKPRSGVLPNATAR